MSKILYIKYKLVRGKWRSKKIAKRNGEFSYPILLTIIEDTNGKYIQVPLSYFQIADMLKKHIWLEKMLDWNIFRIPYQQKVKKIINEAIEDAEKTSSETIKNFFEEIENEEEI